MKFLKVTVTENERGWGQKVDHVKYFMADQKAEADKYVESYNKHNTEVTTPDWYMRAEIVLYEIDDRLIQLIIDWHEANKVNK